MIGSKSQSSVRPAALGSTLQSSTYGQVIPVIFGRAKTALYLIWAANLRQAGGGKKYKKSFGKKNPPDYVENADFLIGHNPIVTPLQFWANQNTRYPLNFVKYTTTGFPSQGTSLGPPGSLTIPDGNFYAVLGVTVTASYGPITFNDYGGSSQTLSGSYEIPLWNAAYAGPDPTFGFADRYGANYYLWTPADGASIQFPQNWSTFAFPPAGATAINVYYAQLDPADSAVYNKANGGTAVPAAALRLTFENILGNGPEFSGTDRISGLSLSDQQILYPHYAGLGSPNFDLGSTQTMPDVRAEILGSYPLYPTGDCDFADMVEDIFKMGLSQAALGAAYNYTQIQRGLGCYEFPGAVQCSTTSGVEWWPNTASFYRPNTQGNILVGAFMQVGALPNNSAADTAGNTWTPLLPSGQDNQIWWASALGFSGQNAVGFPAPLIFGPQATVLEIAGVDSFDAVAYSSTKTCSIATANDAGLPAYVLAFAFYAGESAPSSPSVPHWKTLTQPPTGAVRNFYVQYRIVQNPGTYTFTASGSPLQVALVSFKATQPSSIPKALGNILDQASLDLCRLQCRANGLWGSLVMDSQQNASDWLEDIYRAMNAAPVWSGFKLKSIPYSEVSAVGNGAIYNAPTASGPVANLTESDFIGDASAPLVTIERKAQVDVPNLLQIQHPNRASDYNDVIVSQPETASIALYGPRKDSPKQMRCIQDVGVARMILGVEVRKKNYLRNTYKFKLQAKWKLLEPMDLITLTDSQIGLSALPVRLTSISEDQNYELDCEAEPFIYGCHAPNDGFSLPAAVPVTAAQPYKAQTGASPGRVNTPIIFEPVPRLYGATNQQWLWLVVSAPSTIYGGCQVFLSTDGGSSYNQVGQITGSAITGSATADWPAASDPDTTNDLPLDLTESLGTLSSYLASDRDNFVYPCYVAGGNSSIPYELMTYNTATLTAANKYTLKATGTGNELRRAVFGAPAAGAGVDHPLGSRFAWLGPVGAAAQPGVLKLQMDPTWIGKTLHFKFLAFNNYQGSLESLSDAVDYTYTPTGTVGSVNPSGAPTQLFQINGT